MLPLEFQQGACLLETVISGQISTKIGLMKYMLTSQLLLKIQGYPFQDTAQPSPPLGRWFWDYRKPRRHHHFPGVSGERQAPLADGIASRRDSLCVGEPRCLS